MVGANWSSFRVLAGGNWLGFSLVGGFYSRMLSVRGMIVVGGPVVSFWGRPLFFEQQLYDICVIRYGPRKCVAYWSLFWCSWGKQQPYKFRLGV